MKTNMYCICNMIIMVECDIQIHVYIYICIVDVSNMI